jgi:hypothetical protein
MRRSLFVGAVAVAFMAVTAVPAFASHCINHSKAEGAGNHTDVIVNAATEEVTIQTDGSGAGGWADVWLDIDGDGVGDVLLEEDVQIGRNHSPQYDSEDAWVNPGAINKSSNPHAAHDRGMGFHN